MKPHPRIRKTIKWGGAAVTALLVVVWVRSVFAGDTFQIGHVAVGWDRGILELTGREMGPPYWGHCEFGYGAWDRSAWTAVLGFDTRFWSLTVSLWMCLVPSLITTAAAWRLDTLARRRALLDVCAKCNYDRAGLAKGAVCPECGAATV